MANALPVRAHANLGASSASRWMACPGSVRLTRGAASFESEFAREGTAAHALAETCLRNNGDPVLFVGLSMHGVEITEEMAEAVSVFVEYCRGLIRDGSAEHFIEQKFSLGEINPPEPMFGTVDFAAVNANTRQLDVVDLKFGRGVVVEAKENPQLRYYALGALMAYKGTAPIETVKLTIVQPRVAHIEGFVRSETLDVLELLGFANDLLAAARATQEPSAPLVPGSHCRFCPANARCPAQLERAQAIAQVEFSALPADAPPAPESLPIAVIADMMDKLPILEDWIKAMYQHVQNTLEAGQEVPGLKLVAKRATRKWVSDEQTIAWLQDKGYATEEILDMSLRSPAQIERVLGPDKKSLPAEFVEKRSSGYTVARVTDPRPAIELSPGSEFGVLTDGNGEA
jgi:Protein of unknown function (DUF2800)